MKDKKIRFCIVNFIISVLLSMMVMQLIPVKSDLLKTFDFFQLNNDAQFKLVENSGYLINENELLSEKEDAYLVFKFEDSKVNQINFNMSSSLSQFPIEVYFSDNSKDFNEKDKIALSCLSNKKRVIDLDKKYSYVRLDFGSHSQEKFEINSLNFSNYDYKQFSFVRILLFIFIAFAFFILGLYIYSNWNILCNIFNSNKFIKKHGLKLATIFISLLIFFLLYSNFIFGDGIYIYSNNHIGSDTIDVYYPAYYLMSQKLHSGSFSFFDLRIGLGASIFTLFTGFSIFDILIFLFTPDKVQGAILLVTGLKYLVISFFAVKLFSQYFHDKKIILGTSLLWTFCSFTVMWGQHYSFATAMVYFTAFMYFLNQFLDRTKGSSVKLLITCSIICTSYYFFWMFGLFSVFYSIYYCLRKRYSWKQVTNRVIFLGLIAMGGISLSMVMLLPEIMTFLSSARTISNSNNISILFDSKTIVSVISRFLSSELLGRGYIVGHAYSGSINYYEMAFLSTSIISIPSIIYYFRYKSKNIFDKIFQLIFYCLVFTPYANYLFTFNVNAFRWTFIYIFVFILLIGIFLEELASMSKKMIRFVIRSFIFTFTIIIVLLLIYKFKLQAIYLNWPILLVVVCFFVIYSFILILYNKKRKFLLGFLILLILCESLFMDYYSINCGGYANKLDFFESNYYDGSIEKINEVKNMDSGVYRINKNFSSRLYNDSQVQDYYGVSCYNSFNSQQYLDIYNFYKCASNLPFQHSNYLSISTNDSYLNNLLAVKYYVMKQPSGNLEIQYNARALPFGVLYDDSVSMSDTIPNSLLNLFGYVDKKENSNNKLDELIIQQISLTDQDYPLFFNKENNSTVITLQKPIACHDFSVHYDLQSNSLNRISLDVYDLNNHLVDTKTRMIYPGNNIFDLSFYLPGFDSNEFYIDVKFDNEDVNINSSVLNLYNTELIDGSIINLQKNNIQNLTLRNDTIKGLVKNDSKKDKMLFMPILYSKGWHAYIDNQEAKIEKVNDSFIGVKIPKGTHSITFRYVQDGMMLGFCISIISFVLLLLSQKKLKLFTCIDKSIERRKLR